MRRDPLSAQRAGLGASISTQISKRYPIGYDSPMRTWAGNLIRIARLESGLTQRELAARAGTSQPAIASYESGSSVPTLDTLVRIVRATGHDLRMRLEPLDDHDEALQDYEQSLPPEVIATARRRDEELAAMAARPR